MTDDPTHPPRDGRPTVEREEASRALAIGVMMVAVFALIVFGLLGWIVWNRVVHPPTTTFTAHVCGVDPVGNDSPRRYHVRTNGGRTVALSASQDVMVRYLNFPHDVFSGEVVAIVLGLPERRGQSFHFTVEERESAPGVHNLVKIEENVDKRSGAALCPPA